MQELESKIAEWRRRMTAALPGRPEAVRELEEHLREEIEGLRAQGRSWAEAFERSVERLGGAQEISREFSRLDSRWTATAQLIKGTQGLLAVLLLALAILLVLGPERKQFDLLRGLHVFLLSAGYLSLFVTGLVGAWVCLIRYRRQLFEGERQALRRAMVQLVAGGTVLVPIGIILGMVWAGANRGQAWSWASTEVGRSRC